MKSGDYFYQIKFLDGRVIRRQYVSKKAAMSAHEMCSNEMILLQVQSVTWGVM